MKTDPLAPENEERFWQGYEDARTACALGDVIGDPVADDDYRGGWWAGVGDEQAIQAGKAAARAGLYMCPHELGTDDECFRGEWLNGYFFTTDTGVVV